jgi:hypothetical protein
VRKCWPRRFLARGIRPAETENHGNTEPQR